MEHAHTEGCCVAKKPNEVYLGNMTVGEFQKLPYPEGKKRQDSLALASDGSIIYKKGILPHLRVYPTFVLKNALSPEQANQLENSA